MSNEQIEVQTELLELSIKAGRRMMHDFKHLLSEVPESIIKKEFSERAELWESIFYPDDGVKNYRAKLHMTIDRLHMRIELYKKLLVENGIIDTTTPF